MGTTMTAEAQEARKAYQRQYRARNRDKVNASHRKWCAENRDRIKGYQRNYWEGKAGAGNIRLPWSVYGITPERHQELVDIVKSDKYPDMVLNAALKADRQAAGHIILSVAKGVSYDYLEFHDRIGRCPLGRTNFYGARRLFFHYLDIALKGSDLPSGAASAEGKNVE